MIVSYDGQTITAVPTKPSSKYRVRFPAIPDSSGDAWTWLQCTTTGTSGFREPSWFGTAAGARYTDGTAKWEVIGVTRDATIPFWAEGTAYTQGQMVRGTVNTKGTKGTGIGTQGQSWSLPGKKTHATRPAAERVAHHVAARWTQMNLAWYWAHGLDPDTKAEWLSLGGHFTLPTWRGKQETLDAFRLFCWMNCYCSSSTDPSNPWVKWHHPPPPANPDPSRDLYNVGGLNLDSVFPQVTSASFTTNGHITINWQPPIAQPGTVVLAAFYLWPGLSRRPVNPPLGFCGVLPSTYLFNNETQYTWNFVNAIQARYPGLVVSGQLTIGCRVMFDSTRIPSPFFPVAYTP